jgi:transposase
LEIKVNLSKEVKRFVGWAISNLIKTRKLLDRSKGPPKKVDEEELNERLELLKSMQVFSMKSWTMKNTSKILLPISPSVE